MRKKLSLLIALAISLSVCSTSLAAGVNNSAANTSSSIQVIGNTLKLTMDDAIKNIEGSNTEVKLMKDKMDSLNKQYLKHNQVLSVLTIYLF